MGDSVRIKPQFGRIWKKGKIIEQVDERYVVKTEDFNTIRMNERDVIKTNKTFNDEEYSELDLAMSDSENLEESVDNEDQSGTNVSTSNAV